MNCNRSYTLDTSHVSNGVTKVGVTRCGGLWCHPNFFLRKSDDPFLVIVLKSNDLFYSSSPTPILSAFQVIVCPVFFVNSAAQNFWLSLWCNPLDSVTRGSQPLHSDATACVYADYCLVVCYLRLFIYFIFILFTSVQSTYKIEGKNCCIKTRNSSGDEIANVLRYLFTTTS